MRRPPLPYALAPLLVAAALAQGRDAPTQPVPPPRVVRVGPRAAPPAPPAPPAVPSLALGWSDDELRARPWLAGQTPPRGLPRIGPIAPITPDASLDAGPFEARLAAVARSYLAWGRVDDELRWAPFLCRSPMPSAPRVSRSESGGHAQKVYFLYARDRHAYLRGASVARQVVVKESWTHRPVAVEAAALVGGSRLVARTRGGATVEPDRAAGLFVMMRVGEGDPRSDRGWVYGTVSAAGEVTAAGRVASCIGCHVEAGPGRLFGLPARGEY